jgi:hypothetical protein
MLSPTMIYFNSLLCDDYDSGINDKIVLPVLPGTADVAVLSIVPLEFKTSLMDQTHLYESLHCLWMICAVICNCTSDCGFER